jgi:hypothetical protein
VNLVRPVARAESAVVSTLPAQPSGRVSRAEAGSAGPAATSAAAIAQRPPRAPLGRRRTAAANVDVSALPPVSVVPPAGNRNTLDSIVVARAALLPTMRPTGGVIMATPGGGARGRGGRGGFIARGSAGGGDTNVAVARGGGRAALVPRPDTTRPPR